jgi:glycine/D-amino acid oxidase-like deaminating enzyme
MTKIAILGAGFCGLAAAWHLIQNGMRHIVIFDPQGIGQGASGVAAGLLHPFAGVHAKKNPHADEGMAASLQLIAVAEKTLDTPIISGKGLVRPAVTEQQQTDFALAASQYPNEVDWLSAEACQKKLGINHAYPGIFIKPAYIIECEKYLKGLWTACANEGVAFEKRRIRSLEEVNDFDKIIVTMGAAAKQLPELQHIKLTPIKGQLLELHWPEGVSPPLFPLSSQTYLIMKEGGTKCIAGATFERDFKTEGPDPEIALQEILPKLHPFIPELHSSLLIECRTGLRASTPGHLPLLQRINEKTWLLTGMGSKGLLYHALYADKLAKAISPE